jgi:hypothetical protein
MYNERLRFVELVLFLMSALFITATAYTFKNFERSENLGTIIGMCVVTLLYLIPSWDLFVGKVKQRYALAGGAFLAFYSFCVLISYYETWMLLLGGGGAGLLAFIFLIAIVTGIGVIPLSMLIGRFTQIAFPTGMLIGHWVLIIYSGLTSNESTWLLKTLYIFTHQSAIFAYQHFYISLLFGVAYYVFYYWMQRKSYIRVSNNDKNPLEGGIDL